MKKRNYDKLNLNPHKEARFAMWFWHNKYANSKLGSMAFYETHLKDSDRMLCIEAVVDILHARNEEENEK